MNARGGRSRTGLALAGGGPAGAIYEIGALLALDDAIEGLNLGELDTYVGVSAGAFVAGCLANGMGPEYVCRLAIGREPGERPFRPGIFFRPAIGHWARRALATPRLAAEAIADHLRHPGDQTLVESLFRMTRALPVGLFDNEPIAAFLRRLFAARGRTDDFRRLRRRLIVVAADLDSGEAVRFGTPGHDHVPISRAIQASCALPGLYPPVTIDGRDHVDGVLLKTLHASAALDDGVDLLFAVNPIVPVDTARAVEAGAMRRGRLARRGLPAVLAQTFRTLVHSRLTASLGAGSSRYPGRDIVLVEPPRDDYRMFFSNVFSFADRRAVCRHAYDATRAHLGRRRDELAPLLARHRLRLREAVLGSTRRTAWSGGLPGRSSLELTRRLDRALERLEASHAPERGAVTGAG